MTNPAGGPKTEAGKEVARWNATQHGIRRLLWCRASKRPRTGKLTETE